MVWIQTDELGLGVMGLRIHDDEREVGIIGTAAEQGSEVVWELYDEIGETTAFATGRSSRSAWRAAVRTAAVHRLGEVA